MIDIIPEYEFEGKKLVVSDSYQYGPMCVDRSIRGTGAFEALFFASLEQFRDRFPLMLTFVNQINKRSENAHNNKAHMDGDYRDLRFRRKSLLPYGHPHGCGREVQAKWRFLAESSGK